MPHLGGAERQMLSKASDQSCFELEQQDSHLDGVPSGPLDRPVQVEGVMLNGQDLSIDDLVERLGQVAVHTAPDGVAADPDEASRTRGDTLGSCTLHVCTSCRAPGAPREPREGRPGFKLYQELRELFEKSPLGQRVDVRPAECLSLCPRPCGIALSSPGAWSYLFGDQAPGETAEAIMECVSLYISTADGAMERKRRPKPLRASILGRVPPFKGEF